MSTTATTPASISVSDDVECERCDQGAGGHRSSCRRGRWSPARGALVGSVGVTCAIAAVQFGGTDTGPELCVIRAWTGGWCPGCGGARAAHHLLHGEVAAAWRDHPWVVFAAAQLAVALVAAGAVVASVALTQSRHAGNAPARSPAIAAARARLIGGVWLLANAGLLLAIWAARVSSGAIPSPWSG